MAAPVVHRVDANALIARADNLLVGVWWRSATLDHVEAIRECTGLILADHPAFVTAVLVMDGGEVFSFPDDVRRALVEVVEQTEASGLGTAFVIKRGGFIGGAIRAFLTGLFLVARTKEPQKAFADLPKAAAWLASRTRDSGGETQWSDEKLEHTLAETLALANGARSR